MCHCTVGTGCSSTSMRSGEVVMTPEIVFFIIMCRIGKGGRVT